MSTPVQISRALSFGMAWFAGADGNKLRILGFHSHSRPVGAAAQSDKMPGFFLLDCRAKFPALRRAL
jgi:hypothetical protein